MKKRLVLMALLLSVSPSNAASAQISESALSGKIVTTTNKPVPNLHLTVKNTANDETQFVAVSKDGSFTIYNLAPGIYEITASATGFKPSTESVAIRPGAGQVANIVMQPEATGTGQFPRRRIRVHTQQRVRCAKFLRHSEASLSPQSIWRIGGRADLEGSYLHLRRLRGATAIARRYPGHDCSLSGSPSWQSLDGANHARCDRRAVRECLLPVAERASSGFRGYRNLHVCRAAAHSAKLFYGQGRS